MMKLFNKKLNINYSFFKYHIKYGEYIYLVVNLTKTEWSEETVSYDKKWPMTWNVKKKLLAIEMNFCRTAESGSGQRDVKNEDIRRYVKVTKIIIEDIKTINNLIP